MAEGQNPSPGSVGFPWPAGPWPWSVGSLAVLQPGGVELGWGKASPGLLASDLAVGFPGHAPGCGESLGFLKGWTTGFTSSVSLCREPPARTPASGSQPRHPLQPFQRSGSCTRPSSPRVQPGPCQGSGLSLSPPPTLRSPPGLGSSACGRSAGYLPGCRTSATACALVGSAARDSVPWTPATPHSYMAEAGGQACPSWDAATSPGLQLSPSPACLQKPFEGQCRHQRTPCPALPRHVLQQPASIAVDRGPRRGPSGEA